MKKLIACLSLILLIPFFGMAQQEVSMEITGQVIDVQSNQPLGGCHVFVDEIHGTVSQEDGMFTLSLPIAFFGDDLYFSYVGYQTHSKPLDELVNKFVGVEMQTKVMVLDEVVVIADPWNDFREIISELYELYPDKEDFKKAVLKELEQFDSRLALAEQEEI